VGSCSRPEDEEDVHAEGGTEAEVALSEGRRYIGCDADEHWARVGVERARAAERGTVAAVPSRRAKAQRGDEALPLFGGAR
jgi:hypothetical protein